MTALWLVRHGPTHEKAFTGWRDVPADLSDTGALTRLDAALPRPARLVSSDLIRAVATADALGTGRSRLAHDAALREMHFGDWDGLQFPEVAARDPDLSRRFWEDPGTCAPPNGESWDSTAARVSGAVDAYLRREDGPLVVVAHFGAILTLVARATGLAPAQTLAQDIAPLSRTLIEATPSGWHLRAVNLPA